MFLIGHAILYPHLERSEADLASRAAGVSFGPVTNPFDVAKDAGRDTQFMEKLLSRLVRALLIKVEMCVDSLDSLDRSTREVKSALSSPSRSPTMPL